MNEATTQRALAVAEINPIITELSAFENTIEGFEVVDEESQADLGDLVKLLSSRRAKIEQKRKDLVGGRVTFERFRPKKGALIRGTVEAKLCSMESAWDDSEASQAKVYFTFETLLKDLGG